MMINGYLLSDLVDKVNIGEKTNDFNDIEQETIKLVKNTDFYLDYIENGNEIQITDFNFKYLNSDLVFNDDNFDTIIFKAINEERLEEEIWNRPSSSH